MYKKTNNLLNCSAGKDQNQDPKSPTKTYTKNFLYKLLLDQGITSSVLAVTIASLGGIINLPQTAQAAPTEPSETDLYSSNFIVQPIPEQDSAIAKNSESNREQTLTTPTIEIRSNIETNSFTTISIPQLPSFSLAQNFGNQTITQQIYTVRPGDTISGIARLYGISTKQIIEANNIKNPNRLPINKKLVIPSEETPQVSTNNANVIPFSASNTIAQRTSDSTIDPIVTRDISTNLSSDRESQATVRDPYISRLRADIDKIRDQFQSQYSEESEISINDSSSLMSRESLEPNYIPNPISGSNREDKSLTLENSSSSEEVLISSAIRPIDNYNSLLDSSLKDRLPQLPPLSSPEEYLPDNSEHFDGYMWPAQGTFTSGYGWRWGRMHKGIDIAAPIGTPILAAATGEVIFAGWNSGGYGNLVKVKHPDGSVTFYAHNNKIFVRRGQKIKQGQQIAEMGSTGFSTGPHLHFEIRKNGTKAVNPIALLPRK